MSFLINEFLMAAAKASKKECKIENFSFDFEEQHLLKKQLSQAEEIYENLKNDLSKKKLLIISERIEKLREILSHEVKVPDEFIEHEGMLITPPLLDELDYELQSLDEELNMPKNNLEKQEIKEPEQEEIQKKIEVKEQGLLTLPPPPPKS